MENCNKINIEVTKEFIISLNEIKSIFNNMHYVRASEIKNLIREVRGEKADKELDLVLAEIERISSNSAAIDDFLVNCPVDESDVEKVMSN